MPRLPTDQTTIPSAAIAIAADRIASDSAARFTRRRRRARPVAFSEIAGSATSVAPGFLELEPLHDPLGREVRDERDDEQDQTEIDQRRDLQAADGPLVLVRDAARERVARLEDRELERDEVADHLRHRDRL